MGFKMKTLGFFGQFSYFSWLCPILSSLERLGLHSIMMMMMTMIIELTPDQAQSFLIRSLLRSCLACRDDVDKEKRKYSLISGFTVDSLLMYTSLKRTPRVGPCLSLLPLFDSL